MKTTLKLEFTPDQIRAMHRVYDAIATQAVQKSWDADAKLQSGGCTERHAQIMKRMMEREVSIFDIFEAAVAALDVHDDHTAYDRKIKARAR